uniref:Uncharacterized protein n=1 Tax=Tetranychus urticae TaxID=32264 RepID=T1K3Y7_TETUR
MKINLSWMVSFLCFIGCSIQIYDLTRLYLKYKVRHEMTYDYTDQVELPTIDIIIPMVMAINLTELFIRYPEKMINFCKIYRKTANHTIDNFKSICFHEIKKVATLSSINFAKFVKVKDINELTVDPRQQIDYIQIGDVNVPIDKCKLERYYSGIAIFLRISCTEQAALITDRINNVDSYEGNIATIGHSFGPYFGIRFTSLVDMPIFAHSAYFMIIQKADKLTTSWVRYEKIVSRSLPYPYETNCRNYNKLKALSDCVVKQTIRKGFLWRGVVNEWGSQPEHFGFDVELTTYREARKSCAKLPLLECERTTYIIGGGINSEKVNHTSGLIYIEKPVTPIMYFKAHPELLLSEYLIFLGGIIGTWFAFSILDNLISILIWMKNKVIAKIRKSRESKSPIKLFTIRNSYNFSDPSLNSISDQSRCAFSHLSIATVKSTHELTLNN